MVLLIVPPVVVIHGTIWHQEPLIQAQRWAAYAKNHFSPKGRPRDGDLWQILPSKVFQQWIWGQAELMSQVPKVRWHHHVAGMHAESDTVPSTWRSLFAAPPQHSFEAFSPPFYRWGHQGQKGLLTCLSWQSWLMQDSGSLAPESTLFTTRLPVLLSDNYNSDLTNAKEAVRAS